MLTTPRSAGPRAWTHVGLLQAPGSAQVSALGKCECGLRAQGPRGPAPGLVTSGKETGTAAEGWEDGGYFPPLGAELRLGYFLF